MLTAAESAPLDNEQNAQKIVHLPPARSAEEAYYRYADMVYRLALARCRRKSDAEDVLQDVFTRYLRSAPEFDTSDHQRAWLIRTTINCSNSWLTNAWRRHTVELKDEVLSGLGIDRETEDVYTAVMGLPKNLRTVVHLYYCEGYKISEIAAFTDSAENTVKSRLRRARILLEKELKGDYFDV